MFEDFAIKIKNITKDGMEDVKTLQKSIFKVAQAVEKFALNYGKRHLSGMRSSERIVRSKMGENRNPSNCETVLLTLLKLFLNNRLVSNTLLTEIVKSYQYFPLTSYYTLSSKLACRLRCI